MRHITAGLFAITTLLLSASLLAQTTWSDEYSFRLQDLTFDVCEHPDGGVFVCGATSNNDFENTYSDIWMLAIDENGDVYTSPNWPSNWSHHFGTNQINIAYGICETSSGTCVITGQTGGVPNSVGDINPCDGFLSEVNRWGAVLHNTLLDDHAAYYDVKQTADGGYVAAGANQNTHYQGVVVSKRSSSFTGGWDRVLTNFRTANTHEWANEVIELPDGRFVVAGTNSIEGGRIFLLDDGNSGARLDDLTDSEVEGFTGLVYTGTTFGYPHFIALGSYAGNLSGAPYFQQSTRMAILKEYRVVGNSIQLVQESSLFSACSGIIRNFRLHNIHKAGTSYIVTGVAQLQDSGIAPPGSPGTSGPIIGVLNSSLQLVGDWISFPAEGYYSDYNSFSTWKQMGSVAEMVGQRWDVYLTAPRHLYYGFGGNGHNWEGFVAFKPGVVRTAIQPLEISTDLEAASMTLSRESSEGYSVTIHGVEDAVEISVYDLNGRMVSSFNAEYTGSNCATGMFNPVSESGFTLPTGLYHLFATVNEQPVVQSVTVTY